MHEKINCLNIQATHYKQHSQTQDEKISHLVKDNESWKSMFSETRTRLLNVTYGKSDEAKMDLQKQNANLCGELTRLKQTFVNRLEEYESKNTIHKAEQERRV